MNEKYKDCIGISTNGTRQPNVVDFSTKGGEYTKTYVELPECIKSKTIKSKTMYINLTPPRSGKTYIAKLEQQLQAYKDKEDKLREILNKHTPANEDIILYEIKQILNEGSNK